MLETHQLPPLPRSPEKVFGPGTPQQVRPVSAGRPGRGRQAVHYNWAHANMRYLPNEARQEAEDAILAAQAQAAHYKSHALDAFSAQGTAETKLASTEREASLKAQDDEALRQLQAAQYEERLSALEDTLEAERAAHAAALEELHTQLEERTAEAAARVDLERRLREEAVAAADARAREAERAADEACRRAEADAAAARAAADARVKEIRRMCEERVNTHEAQRRLEAERLRAEVAAEKRATQETSRACYEQRRTALDECKKRVYAVEAEAHSWFAKKDRELAKKEAMWTAWGSQQEQHKKDFEQRHKGMLELEQGLHRRTMERTLDRITRHLQFGNGDANPGEPATPTKEVFAAAAAPAADCAARTAW